MKKIDFLVKRKIINQLVLLFPAVLVLFTSCINETEIYDNYPVNFSVEGSGGTLTAEVDGNSIVSGAEIEYNKTIIFTAIPEAGYKSVWTGITPESGSPNSAKMVVTEAVNVVVEFVPERNYNITYYLDDGINSADNPKSYNAGTSTITLQPATKTGCTFEGWYDNPSLTGNPVIEITQGSTGDKEFWAKWSIKTYPVNFSVDGTGGTLTAEVDGNSIVSGAEIEYNKTIIFTAIPEAGYKSVWTGITPESGSPNSASLAVTEAVNVVVEFVPERNYNITYYPDDGINSADNPTNYNASTPTIILQPATKTGFTFEGWYDNPSFTGNPVTEIIQGSTGDKEFWAKWSIKTYQLFFSEYIEGSSWNKALEIYNGSSEDVLMDNIIIRIYSNGSSEPSKTINLDSGTLAPQDVWVIGHTEFKLASIDQSSSELNFNGDDAIELCYNGITVDVIGQIGVDPGQEWGEDDCTTKDHTLRRKCEVTSGDIDGSDVFDPSIEWNSYGINTVSDLGTHCR